MAIGSAGVCLECSPAATSAAVVGTTSVVFFALGAIGAATALQALYEQVFDLDHLFSGIVITDNRKSAIGIIFALMAFLIVIGVVSSSARWWALYGKNEAYPSELPSRNCGRAGDLYH